MIVLALLMQLALESPQEAFARAEALYQEQRYDDAAEVYESLRALGIEDRLLRGDDSPIATTGHVQNHIKG